MAKIVQTASRKIFCTGVLFFFLAVTLASFAQHYVVSDFEGYSPGDEVIFQEPGYSGSTTGIDAATDIVGVSNSQANNILDPSVGTIGVQSYRIYWKWLSPGTGFARCTTYNVAHQMNPIIDFTKGLSIYVKVTQGEIDMSYWVRETGVSGVIGSSDGASGAIERCTRFVRLSASPEWQYVYFDVPNEPYLGLTGNSVLDGQWGTLESLVFQAVSGSPA
ncbi:hypothetical protein JW926_04020, partial [Candidatus Sumerlaeota bacterium]|nr:hypothetical protein [Candidatus Sumerlaeota bacterium]